MRKVLSPISETMIMVKLWRSACIDGSLRSREGAVVVVVVVGAMIELLEGYMDDDDDELVDLLFTCRR